MSLDLINFIAPNKEQPWGDRPSAAFQVISGDDINDNIEDLIGSDIWIVFTRAPDHTVHTVFYDLYKDDPDCNWSGPESQKRAALTGKNWKPILEDSELCLDNRTTEIYLKKVSDVYILTFVSSSNK